MSSSNSSSPKTFVVGLVAMEKKRTMNNPKQGSPQKVVPERTITERPRFGLGVVRAEKDVMKKYQPKDNTLHVCKICWRGFPTGSALGGHQNSHKFDREFERQLKKMEPSFSMKPCNSYQGTSSSVFGGLYDQSIGGDGSSVRTTTFPSLTSTFPPFTRGTTYVDMDVDMVVGYPVSPYRSFNGNTSYGSPSGTPLLTHNHNHRTLSNANHLGLSFGPFKSRGVGSNIVGGTSGGNTVMNMTMVPPATTPYRSFTEKTSHGSSSRDPVPSHNDSTHALALELSLGPDNPIGSSSNNNSTRTLEHSLGPSKTIRGGNTNSSVDPSLNGGVKKVITDLNMPVRPSVSRYQFHGHSPLNSITRNVPLLVSPPPPTTNLSNDENVSGSSYSEKTFSKERKKLGVLEDDEDHDEHQPEEVEAKSWGRDLSFFL